MTTTVNFKGKNFVVEDGGLLINEQDVRDKFWTVKENDIVLDIGAKPGDYTLAALSQGAYVYAFEPSPMAITELWNNLRYNDLSRLTLICIGLYNREGVMSFVIEPDWKIPVLEDNHNPIYPNSKLNLVTTTIDLVVERLNIPNINFIKIDTEGAEPEIIEGGLISIRKFKPTIIAEMHNDNHMDKIKKILGSDYNYQLHESRFKHLICTPSAPVSISLTLTELKKVLYMK